ncbi:uncharacterized protein J8A68_004218, partial [[Candida] subhashii]
IPPLSAPREDFITESETSDTEVLEQKSEIPVSWESSESTSESFINDSTVQLLTSFGESITEDLDTSSQSAQASKVSESPPSQTIQISTVLESRNDSTGNSTSDDATNASQSVQPPSVLESSTNSTGNASGDDTTDAETSAIESPRFSTSTSLTTSPAPSVAGGNRLDNGSSFDGLLYMIFLLVVLY